MFDQKKQNQNSRLGNILLAHRYVNQYQLDKALQYQQETCLLLGEALLALGYINDRQLKRALRRQTWRRSVTTCVALIMAPFSPAFATNFGGAGSSSSISSQITLNILPKTVNNGSNDLKFTATSNVQVSESVCTSDFKTDIYRITAVGSGKQGEFVLTDEQQRKLNYQVAFKHHGEAFEKLNVDRASSYFYNNLSNRSGIGCLDADDNRLRVSLERGAQEPTPQKTVFQNTVSQNTVSQNTVTENEVSQYEVSSGNDFSADNQLLYDRQKAVKDTHYSGYLTITIAAE